MTTLKNDFGHFHLTRLTFLEANIWAPVPILADDFLAWFHALELLVGGVIWVAGTCAHMPTGQPELTGQAAASFRYFLEVGSFGYKGVGLRVVLATEAEGWPYLVVLSKGMDDPAPQGHLGKHLHVPNAVHALLGPGQGYADAVGYLEEAHLALLVASHQREENDVILFPLVLVHHMDLDASKRLDRHELAQAEELPRVGGKDGDLRGQVLLAQKVLAQLHHKVCLMLVLVASAFLDLLFRKAVLHKEKVAGDTLNLLILENRRMVL